MPQAARIRPGVPAPGLVGRIGTAPLRERAGVRYLPLQARSLVNRCDAPRMPFDWTVNPYRGCAMGCRYCYAAYTHEFMGVAASDFHSTVYVKQQDWQETARKLRTAARQGEPVALGTATDPYQPGETEWRVTRRFLELAAQFRGLELGITTKGAIILRDLDLLRRIKDSGRLSVHLSLISLRADLVRRLEPWAPPPQVRIDVLRRLCDAGLDPWLSIAPVLPGLTDAEADLDALLASARAAGVRHARYNVLFLRSPTREKYLEFLKTESPRLHEAHERAYAGRVFLRGKYPERLRALFRKLAERHGFEGGAWSEAGPEPPRADALQLGLWGP